MRRRLRGSTLLWDAEISGTVATGGELKNADFVEGGELGYIIRADGTAEFNEVVIRGSLDSGSGSFTGNLVGGTLHVPAEVGEGFHVDAEGRMWVGATGFSSAPFRVDRDGSMEADTAIINGSISTALTGSRVTLGQDGVNYITLDHGEDAERQALLTAQWDAGTSSGILVLVGPRQDSVDEAPTMYLTHYEGSTRQVEFRDIDKFYIYDLPTVAAVTANVYLDPATNELKRIV